MAPRKKRVRSESRIDTASSGESIVLQIAGDRPAEWRVEPYPELKRDAMYWSYVVRTRARWTGTVTEREESPITRFLEPSQLEQIARAGQLEVEIPFSSEDEAWEWRVLPWEYLLSQATKPFRNDDQPLTVTRRLACPGTRPAATAGVSLAKLGIVQSAPGVLAKSYDVKGEGDMVLQALGLDPRTEHASVRRVADPTRKSLQEWLTKGRHTALHVAGVDEHQAIDLCGLEREIPTSERRDGLALRPQSGARPDFIAANDLARLVCGGGTPQLVFYNFYNSASRIAALTVAHGAAYAIGYQDTIDDDLAAVFLSALYRALAENGGEVRAAFSVGLKTLRSQTQKLRGAGVVLWSAQSLIAEKPAAKSRAAKLPRLKRAEEVEARERITVLCRPYELVNYSQLHNGRSLFKELTICRGAVSGPIHDIEVSVNLHLGEEASCPFVQTLTLPADKQSLPLDQVIVPLTSSLIRTRRERIQSSLQVCVRCADARVFQDTYRVWFAPVDEWQDGKREDWQWLPSFVLPRDPAVARIIESAQRYLVAVSDDPDAGFDGYQSVDSAGAPGEGADPVDAQVRAIWHAILQEQRLSYINPPPSYGEFTQRLRMPSQILAEHRGTCIDLAMLIAACLEYVDIYPVIFLLEGHAFPGYWRSEAAHNDFRAVRAVQFPQVQAGATEQAMRSTAAGDREAGFVSDRSNFDEIRQQVYKGFIVPLESVWLTNHSSFASAMDEGRSNLRNRAEFQAMIDIKLARDSKVTPVPLLWSVE